MKKRIFISSVQREFASERRELAEYIRKDAILGKFFEVFIFEEVPAQDRPASGVYLDEVDACDIYLGLHGASYGNVDEKGVSATEREYERAEKSRKTRICFLKHGGSSDPRQSAFLARINADVVRSSFSDYDGLRVGVYAALAKYLESTNMLHALPFDASSTAELQLSDLSVAKIKNFVRDARRLRNWEVAENAKPLVVLDKLNLLGSNGAILNPAGLLFGKRPQRHFRSSQVKCAWFLTEREEKPIADHKIFEGDVFEVVDAATMFVMSHLNTYVGAREGGGSVQAPTKFELPESAVKEAIVNAVCHRDYTSAASVQVMLFKDRLEIWNPAELPKGMTIAKLYKAHKSYPTNPFLARAMFLRKYIEETGTGAKDMIEKCAEYGLPKPRWSLEDGDDFRVVILRPKSVAGPNKVPVNDAVSEAVKDAVNDAVKSLYACIKQNPGLNGRKLAVTLSCSEPTIDRHVKTLKKAGLVEFRGAPKNGGYYCITPTHPTYT